MSESDLRSRLDEAGREMGVSINHGEWDYVNGSLSNPNFSRSTVRAEESGLVPNRDPDSFDGQGNPAYELGGHDGGVLLVRGDGELVFKSRM